VNLRSTIYWLLSILVLVLCLTYSQPSPDNKTIKPIALTTYLDVKPLFFYYNNKQFHATVVDQLRLDIKVENISENISKYNTLIIQGYQFKQNIQFSLNWQVKQQNHQVLINKTIQSINPFNFETDDASEISNLHLLITSTQELGLSNNFQNEILFQSIHLDISHNQSQLAINHSEWNDFTAVKLSSINGHTNHTDLHYKYLILRLCSWLILAALMFWMLKINGTHLITTLFIAWIISGYYYASNHIKQHSQLSQAFTPGQTFINRTDQQTHELAEHISAKIKTEPIQISSSDKLILFGANTFFKLRLKHHLQQFNIGTHLKIKQLLENSTKSKFKYLLVGKQLKYCTNLSRYDWLKNQVEIIHMDDNFCLLRKK